MIVARVPGGVHNPTLAGAKGFVHQTVPGRKALVIELPSKIQNRLLKTRKGDAQTRGHWHSDSRASVQETLGTLGMIPAGANRRSFMHTAQQVPHQYCSFFSTFYASSCLVGGQAERPCTLESAYTKGSQWRPVAT